MGKRASEVGCWMCAGVLLAASMALGGVAVAQGGSASDRPHPAKQRVISERAPEKPSIAPTWTIPAEPLGFTAPGPHYLGRRNVLASLDFLDEDRLLFTFRVPGLIHRQLQAGETDESDERQIRAVVVNVPTGAVESETLWTVHDQARYLWMLKGGRFLVRDKSDLEQGDATLGLKPMLHFPGPLVWVEMDPTGQYLVTNSFEPAAGANGGKGASGATAAASMESDDLKPESQPNADVPGLVVRILKRETGQVILVSRSRSTVHLPIDGEGYLENLRGRGMDWVLNLTYFTGGSRIVGHVDSTCLPITEFLSAREVVVTACTVSGERRLVAMTTDGRTLWDDLLPGTAIWPLIVRSPNGERVARETLAVSHAVSASAPISQEDIKGQSVRVFDAATGEMAMESPASPMLDAGGNVAMSPSGRRVAVLNAGALQVFELPAPPALPDGASNQAAH